MIKIGMRDVILVDNFLNRNIWLIDDPFQYP